MSLRREHHIVAGLCLLAVVRVLVFTAAVPFFSSEDEQQHFDAILQYGGGYHAQKQLPKFLPQSAEMIERYQAFEFFTQPGQREPAPAGWCDFAAEGEATPGWLATYWERQPNDQVSSPPLYYYIAYSWYRVGGWLGWRGLYHLSWTRFLNAFAYGLLLLFSYLFLRRCYPDNEFLHLAVPAFLLVFPQQIEYALNPNTLFAPTVALALWLLSLDVDAGERSALIYIAAGLSVAAAVLTGLGNFIVLIPLVWAVWANRRRWLAAAGLLLGAALPIGYWATLNRMTVGDWTGASAKEQFLGWTTKPAGAILQHPIFSASGFWFFVKSLCRNFWRGEMAWHAQPLTSWIDHFYLWSTLILIAIFIWLLTRKRHEQEGLAAFADWSALAMVVASIAFLVFLSVRYDFGQTYYPSRAKPFFVSGRLIFGAVLPFAIIYLRSLQTVCAKIGRGLNPWLVGIPIFATILITETIVMAPVFASPYNFYAAALARGCR